MPQMAPALWLPLFITTVYFITFLKSILYFYLPVPYSLSQTSNLTIKLTTWPW